MSGTELLVDTNILIALSSGNELLATFLEGKVIKISFVTEIELLSKPDLTTSEERILMTMIGQCRIVGTSDHWILSERSLTQPHTPATHSIIQLTPVPHSSGTRTP